MPKKNVKQLRKEELKKRKKKITIGLGILLLVNAAYMLFGILVILNDIDISLFVLVPVFFVLFMLAVAVNLMRVSIEQELARRDKISQKR